MTRSILRPSPTQRATARRGAALLEAVLAAGLVAVAALTLAAPVTRAVAIAADGRAVRERWQALAAHAGQLAAAARSGGCGRWPAPPAPLTRQLAFSSDTWEATLALAGPRRAADSLRLAGVCIAAVP